MKSAYKSFKRTATKEPALVTKVKEATGSQPWGPHGAAMAEICAAISECIGPQHGPQGLQHAAPEVQEAYAQVMDTLWTRLDDVPENFRKVHKALIVLEYCLLRAPLQLAADVQRRSFKFKDLAANFAFVDPITLKDEGRVVRTRAQRVADLVTDEQLLHAERAKVAATARNFETSTASMGSASTGDAKQQQQQQQQQQQLGFGAPAAAFDQHEHAFGDSAFNPSAGDGPTSTPGFGAGDSFNAGAAAFNTTEGYGGGGFGGEQPFEPNGPATTAVDFGADTFGTSASRPSDPGAAISSGEIGSAAGSHPSSAAHDSSLGGTGVRTGTNPFGEPEEDASLDQSQQMDPFAAIPQRKRNFPKVEIKPLAAPKSRTPRKPASDPALAELAGVLAPPPAPGSTPSPDPFGFNQAPPAPAAAAAMPAAGIAPFPPAGGSAVPVIASLEARGGAPAPAGASTGVANLGGLQAPPAPQQALMENDPFGGLQVETPVIQKGSVSSSPGLSEMEASESSKDILKKHIGLDDASASLVRLDLGTTFDGSGRSPEKSSGMMGRRAMKPGMTAGQKHLFAPDSKGVDPLAVMGQAQRSPPDPRPFGPTSPVYPQAPQQSQSPQQVPYAQQSTTASASSDPFTGSFL